ncbi:MAG TPA: hypothetical protein VEM27_01870, partial [Gemmatimonadales bacterium]|nr:hypothetical protein [Gemmatimonadales bacterium]
MEDNDDNDALSDGAGDKTPKQKKVSSAKFADFLTDQYNKISKERDELKTQVQQLQFKITQLEKTMKTQAREKRASRSDSGSSNKPNQPKINDPPPPGPSTLQTENNDTKVKKVPAPEAITVYGVKDFNKFQEAILNNHTEGAFFPVFSTLGNGTIKIKAACVDSYRQILNLLKEMQEITLTNNEQDTQVLGKIEYHCYKLKQERNYCFIIRGLHPTTELQRIKDALFQQGYKVCHIVNLRKRIKSADGAYSYKQLPLHRVEIISTEHNKEVLDIKELLYTKVTMEAPWKTRVIPQCVRCQQFGHTKNYCAIAQRCVKCAGNHWTKECKKPIDTKPTCANCGGEHPANYKGCPVYKKKQEALTPKREKVTRRMQKKQWQPAKPAVGNLSYAKVAATGTSAIPTTNRYQQLAQQQQPEPTQHQAQPKKHQKQSKSQVPKKQQQVSRQPQQQAEHQNHQKQSKSQLPKKQA